MIISKVEIKAEIVVQNDARQIVRRRKKKRRFLEQSFHRAFFENMKKHVKRILNEELRKSLRDVNEKYHVKKNEITQKLNQIEKFVRYSYENEMYKTD
jgi:lantibiotic modifying enzyme